MLPAVWSPFCSGLYLAGRFISPTARQFGMVINIKSPAVRQVGVVINIKLSVNYAISLILQLSSTNPDFFHGQQFLSISPKRLFSICNDRIHCNLGVFLVDNVDKSVNKSTSRRIAVWEGVENFAPRRAFGGAIECLKKKWPWLFLWRMKVRTTCSIEKWISGSQN